MVEHDTDRGAEKIADGGTDGIKRKRGTKSGWKRTEGTERSRERAKRASGGGFWRSLMIL